MGLSFEETMRGTWYLVGEPDEIRPCEFTVSAHLADLVSFVRGGLTTLRGSVTLDGLATRRPLEGTLEIAPLRRRIRYAFTFSDDAGRALAFRGAKVPSPLRPVRTMTVLHGSVFEGDKVVARALLHFDIRRDLAPMLQSFSFVR